MPPALAGMLLAGLLADTLILTSPTTTPRDQDRRRTTIPLGIRRGARSKAIPSKVTENPCSAPARALEPDPKDVVSTDIKPFESGGYKFAVAQ